MFAVLATLHFHVLLHSLGTGHKPLQPSREPTSHSYHVLLCDVALHVAVGVFVLKELGEGGVLGVSIQSHHVLVVTAQLGQSHAVRLPRSNLVTQGQTDNQSINYNRYRHIIC